MTIHRQAERVERGILALGLLLLGGFMVWNLVADHRRIEASQRLRLGDQARIIDDNLSRQLVAVNNALKSLQDHLPALLAQSDGRQRLSRRLEATAGAMPDVRTLFVLDRDGRVIASSRAPLVGLEFEARAYFQHARRDNDPNVLHLSPPIGNALGAFAINLERSTMDGRGGFDGLVAATLDPEYFTTLLNSVNYAPDSWVSLAHADGTLFVTVPDHHFPPGNSLAKPGSLFSRHMESGQVATLLTGQVLVDGALRMVARRTIRPAGLNLDAPLIVGVTRDQSAIFARWRRDAWIQATLFLLVVASAVAGLSAHQRRQGGLAELARAQEANLRESEARFRSLFEAHSAVMLLIDPVDGRIEAANPAAARFYGYSREALGTMRIFDLNAAPADQVRQAFQRAARGEATRFQFSHRLASGALRTVEVSSSPTAMSGQTRLFSIVMDITERVRMEGELALRRTELETLNQSLEVRVEEAVAQLRAKDRILMTQSRQAAMGEMIGNIAHQWRQPLNALSMVLVNLEDAHRFHDLDQVRFEQALAKGSTLIQKMSSTINDFRDFFRPGKQRTAFSALEQVRATVALVEAAFLAKGIALVIQAPADLALSGLPNELSQVLLNLLSNAKEAIQEARTPHGWITIGLAREDGWGCLSVADNGGGIPEACLERIFEPYFSTRETGTGVGLYMSRQIVEQSLKGRILVRNEAGGAVFTVQLPLEEAGS